MALLQAVTKGGRHGRDRMVVGFMTTYAEISAYQHYCCESRSWRGVLDTTLCDKICQRHAVGRWVSSKTSVSSTNKTDIHDIAEMLLKLALSTIALTLILLLTSTQSVRYTVNSNENGIFVF